MKNLFITTILLFPLLLGVSEPRIVAGPKRLPNIEPDMQKADFWIKKIINPDQIIISKIEHSQQIKKWQSLGLLTDIFQTPAVIPRTKLKAWLTEDFSFLKRAALFGEKGERLNEKDYLNFKSNVNVAALQGSNPTRYGMTVRATGLRLFPTSRIATAKPRDLEFNVLQHSGLRLAEPLVVLHYSQDKKWYFVRTTIGQGWILAQDTALADSRAVVVKYVAQATHVVVDAQVTFKDSSGKRLKQTARMGAYLHKNNGSNKYYSLPQRAQTGKLRFVPVTAIPATGIQPQVKACTSRNLIQQAFLALDQPYGWGGSSGFGDCSEFIHRVGLTCGLNLPRSTTELRQGLKSQTLPPRTELKKRVLAQAATSGSLIYLPGHIMLVLGKVDNQIYVIHNIYGIHAQDQQGPFIRRVARVVVSDLSLGQGSQKGSLLKRIERILFFDSGP